MISGTRQRCAATAYRPLLHGTILTFLMLGATAALAADTPRMSPLRSHGIFLLYFGKHRDRRARVPWPASGRGVELKWIEPGARSRRLVGPAHAAEFLMAEFVIQVGGRSAQGRRPNNEDRFVADPDGHVFLVADGMGGQDCGEQASGMAADIIPRVLQDRLAAHDDASHAVQKRLRRSQPSHHPGRPAQNTGRPQMGTTAVLALQQDDQVYVASLGDSRAYLVSGDRVEQLTVDHTVADALARNGTLTADQAKTESVAQLSLQVPGLR